MEEFDYFMIRTRRRGAGLPLSGMIERLATGEKLDFRSGKNLLELLDRWPGSLPRPRPSDPSEEIQS